MTKLLTIAIAAWAVIMHGAAGQLVTYTISGINSSAGPLAASLEDSHLSAASLTLGPGLVVPSGTGNANSSFGGSGWDGASDAASAVEAGNYISFTLTVDEGFAASFSTIDAYNIRHSGTGPTAGLWQFSLDGTTYASIGSQLSLGSGTSSSGNAMAAVDLSGIAALQDVASGTAVTFRFVAWGATSSGGTGYFNGQGTNGGALTLTGTTVAAVPEPGIIALLGSGLGLGLWTMRRRLRAAARTY